MFLLFFCSLVFVNSTYARDFRKSEKQIKPHILTDLAYFQDTLLQKAISIDSIEAGFESPPASAKARTWWHWLNGNISKNGITADLEAMKRAGIQEAQIFNVKLNNPSGPVDYLSDTWLELFHFAANEAKRLDMELSFHNGAGWSSSGGPWVTAEYAMQTVVYSQTYHIGGKTFKGTLPQPDTQLDYYKDIAILAFPKPKGNDRIDGLDFKTLSGKVRNNLLPDPKIIPAASLIKSSEIIDLTTNFTPNSMLHWDAPEGDWVILRIGYTPTGKKNHPAPLSGTGLEIDKMNRKAVDLYWQRGINPILEKLDTLVGTVVKNCLIDSYEVGTANWTHEFENSFKHLRGYECLPYLPALAGYYIESGEITERFLWDFRKTIGDLIAENYYGYFGQLCHENGLNFSVEPYWGAFDNMKVGATADIVMSEFWSDGYPFFDSPKFVSSIAHLKGSTIVGAEAFTGIGGWKEHPATIKSVGDQAWAQGINRFIFHTYVHQPWNIPPGLTLSYHGLDFNRLNTWWEQGKAYLDYVARSQFLLQQGKSVNDVLVFTGESSPNNASAVTGIKSSGFDYDLIGVNNLMTLTVRNKTILTPAGGNYRVLVLPDTEWLSPESLGKLKELVNAGATVIGPRPMKSPGLSNYPLCDKQLAKGTEELWGYGLIKDLSITDFLKKSEIPPDFSVIEGDPDDLSFTHRKDFANDIYFIANGKPISRNGIYRFRVSGKYPEIWNPETGKITKLAQWNNNHDGTTNVPFSLEPEEAVFIVFRQPTKSLVSISKSTALIKRPKSQPFSDLKIIKAEYGTFLPQGIEDITAIVASKIQDGKLNIIANRALCDCDPAMGYNKELRLEYSIGNKVEQIHVLEREPVIIDGKGNGILKIRKALFGKFKAGVKGLPDGYPTFDVTKRITSMVNAGVMEVPVNDSLTDGKTPQGNNRALRITYVANGVTRTISVCNGETLVLSQDNPEPLLYDDGSEILWKTAYPGKLHYQTSNGDTGVVKVDTIPEPVTIKGPWKLKLSSTSVGSSDLILKELKSWSLSSDVNLKYYSGTATYYNEFDISGKLLQDDVVLELDLGSVGVIAEIFVNGKSSGVLWKYPFRVELNDKVKEGMNKLEIRVTNLWPNRLIGDDFIPLDFPRTGPYLTQWPSWLENPSKRKSKRQTFSGYKHWNKESELFVSGLLGPVIVRPYIRTTVLKHHETPSKRK